MTTNTDIDRIYTTLGADTINAAIMCDAIAHDLALRDAIILRITAPALTRDEFRLLAEQPKSSEARELTERTTMRVLQHHDTTDTTHITRIAHLLGDEASQRRDPQAHATAAYLMWFAGDDRGAAEHALTALSLDDTTTLAALVITAIQRGIRH